MDEKLFKEWIIYLIYKSRCFFPSWVLWCLNRYLLVPLQVTGYCHTWNRGIGHTGVRGTRKFESVPPEPAIQEWMGVSWIKLQLSYLHFLNPVTDVWMCWGSVVGKFFAFCNSTLLSVLKEVVHKKFCHLIGGSYLIIYESRHRKPGT